MAVEKRRSNDWHMSEKVIAGIIVALSVSVIGQVVGGIYLFKQLNTSPPIPERLLRLEYQMSDFAQTMQRLNHTMEKMEMTINTVAKEQARRTPMVDAIEKQMHNGAHP